MLFRSYASLIFNGVKSFFEYDNIDQLSGANSKRAFITLYRCAENGSGSYWELITPTTGDLSSIRRNVVENEQTPEYYQWEFIDNLQDVNKVYDKFWYVGFSIVNPSDSQNMQTIVSDEAALEQALDVFDNATSDTQPSWSPPVVTSYDNKGSAPTQRMYAGEMNELPTEGQIGRAHV